MPVWSGAASPSPPPQGSRGRVEVRFNVNPAPAGHLLHYLANSRDGRVFWPERPAAARWWSFSVVTAKSMARTLIREILSTAHGGVGN
jgi:hypothetical protein